MPDPEAQQQLERAMAKRRAQGEALQPLSAPQGSRALCQSFWGKAWCRHLEAHEFYAARLPAGRRLLRQGKVMDLQIAQGEVHGVVAASRLHDCRLHIRPLEHERWQSVLAKAQGQVGSMLELLSGQLGEALMQGLTDFEHGIFPLPGELRGHCDCEDYADLCPHAFALLHAVALRLDDQPELLFTLRGVNAAELLAQAQLDLSTQLPQHQELAGQDLGEIFGIDLAS
jgi:uncharacterized Zn finger protein